MNSARKSGSCKLLVGVAGLLLIGTHAYHFVLPDKENFNSLLFLPFLALAVYSLVGCVELATGSHFERYAATWERLASWQRGIIGSSIVVIMTLMIIYCIPPLLSL